MSRLQTGSMEVLDQSTDVDERDRGRRRQPGPTRPGRSTSTCRPTPPRPDRPGAAGAGRGQPGRQRPGPRRRDGLRVEAGAGGRPGGHPGHRPRPGHPRARTATGSSSPSSGSATRTTGPAWAWAWPWPGGSWRRSAASSTSRTPRAAAAPWWSGSRPLDRRTRGPSGLSEAPARRTCRRRRPKTAGSTREPIRSRERAEPGPPGPTGVVDEREPRCWSATTTPRCCGPSTISLTARGYEVVVARTGEEGLDQAAHRHPDVVLLDLGPPRASTASR